QVIFKYLLTDDNGAYQLTSWDNANQRPAVDPVTGAPVLNVEWMISATDYYAITGKRLQASSVRRLNAAAANGLHHMLITNRFSGADNPQVFGSSITLSSAFHGEVFEVDP